MKKMDQHHNIFGEKGFEYMGNDILLSIDKKKREKLLNTYGKDLLLSRSYLFVCQK